MSQFLSFSFFSSSLSLKPTTVKPFNSKSLPIMACSAIPARDRIIDFGKYKGRMLGSLPSTYLKWVSTNLRARDFEDWAKLADQVLDDPVYRDRLEWEFAQKVLNGDVLSSPFSSSSSSPPSGVSSLLEISERFGWDNEDKLGWSKLNFDLLGTSNGGRIPRVKEKGAEISKKEEESGSDEDEVNVGERRGERRERLKLKRRIRSTSQRSRAGFEREEMKKATGKKIGDSDFGSRNEPVEVCSRFPGREGLLRRVMEAKGRRSTM